MREQYKVCQQLPCELNSEELICTRLKKAMVTTQMSGVITMKTMFFLTGLKRCMFPMRTF